MGANYELFAPIEASEVGATNNGKRSGSGRVFAMGRNGISGQPYRHSPLRLEEDPARDGARRQGRKCTLLLEEKGRFSGPTSSVTIIPVYEPNFEYGVM